MRKNLIALGVVAAILITTNFNQAVSQSQQPVPLTSDPVSSIFLPEDTPVRLRLTQNLSSATAKLNEKVDFEVIEDVKVGNLVVIPQGATAIGTITEARTKKSFGRAGKLNVNIDYVRLANGDKVALRAVKGGTGGNKKGVMTGAVVATAIVFFPAAPLFFFIKGKNIEIPKGTEISAYVAADTTLDPAKFGNAQMVSRASNTPHPPSGSTSDPGLATILVKSTPDASDITVDGRFVGSTTSTLRLPAGDHTILIEKAGFKPWQRTISVTTNGNITVDATLERVP
jgi:hypothetical protein